VKPTFAAVWFGVCVILGSRSASAEAGVPLCNIPCTMDSDCQSACGAPRDGYAWFCNAPAPSCAQGPILATEPGAEPTGGEAIPEAGLDDGNQEATGAEILDEGGPSGSSSSSSGGSSSSSGGSSTGPAGASSSSGGSSSGSSSGGAGAPPSGGGSGCSISSAASPVAFTPLAILGVAWLARWRKRSSRPQSS
jgi:hypothetical protein